MNKYPQSMINVPVGRKIDLDYSEPVQQAVREAQAQLGPKGRILLRPSGTEPVIRVMVEGIDYQQVEMLAKDLAGVVEDAAAD
jgi:phosphoglucosamine mutase